MKARAIVLAAGAGRRFGGGKLLAPYGGRPLVAWAVEAALASDVEEVILVVAPDGQAVAGAARSAVARSGRPTALRVVVAHGAAEGMGASLRAGAAEAPDDAALVVFLADMPRIDPAMVGRLIAALDGGAVAARPVFDGLPAHPVALAPDLRAAVLRLGGDVGAREVIADLGERLALVQATDDGVLFDVDRPEDLLAAHRIAQP